MSKIALPIAELKPALIGLGKIVSKRCTLPVLNHLKIERTADGWIAVTGTDLDHYVTVRLEQPSDGEPLSLLVPYDELLKITKTRQKTDKILVGADDPKTVTIEYAIGSQMAEAKVESLPVEEFPEIPRIKGEPIPLNDALRQSLHEALECASTDETRLILNGAFIDVSKSEGHYVVGTDGHHLYSSNSFSLPMKDSLIIPSHKFIGWKEFNHDGEWQLKVMPPEKKDEPGHLQISTRRWRFITKQLDGNYPNWRQVVPISFDTSLEFDPTTVEQVIQTIQRMPDHEPINHSIGLECKGKKLNLLCKPDKDQPWMPVSVENPTIKGPDVTIYLNRHLLVKALEFGLLRVNLTDPMSPLRFSYERRQMIVMPTRPNGPPQTSVTAPKPKVEEISQPAAKAAQPNTTMPKPNGTNGDHQADEKPALDKAVDQVEAIKATIKSAVGGLNDLIDMLKQVQREQKTTDKEVQSVRSTLEKLQSVKI